MLVLPADASVVALAGAIAGDAMVDPIENEGTARDRFRKSATLIRLLRADSMPRVFQQHRVIFTRGPASALMAAYPHIACVPGRSC